MNFGLLFIGGSDSLLLILRRKSKLYGTKYVCVYVCVIVLCLHVCVLRLYMCMLYVCVCACLSMYDLAKAVILDFCHVCTGSSEARKGDGFTGAGVTGTGLPESKLVSSARVAGQVPLTTEQSLQRFFILKQGFTLPPCQSGAHCAPVQMQRTHKPEPGT